MSKDAKLKVKDLLVNTENFRFETVANEEEAIEKMLEDQSDKLVNLAEHILEHGLDPSQRIIVSPSQHEQEKFNALEGNRRIIALKILENPNLITVPKYLPIKKRFEKLKTENQSKPVEVDCVIYEDPAEANEWIKLKHGGESNGVGTVRWDAQQVQRFTEKIEGKTSLALQVLSFLAESDNVPAEVKSKLNDLPITNLYRLISDRDVRTFLGLEISGGTLYSSLDKAEVTKGLLQVAKDLLDPDFKVRRIYSKVDRIDYLNNFPKESRPTLTAASTNVWKLPGDLTGKKVSKSKIMNPKERKYLIPKSCVLKINNPKVNAIYYELQRLNLSNFKNASAVSFRVFIELSGDCYIEEHQLAGKQRTLADKVALVMNHLISNTLIDKKRSKGIQTSVNNKNDLLGIDTWHAYVHNNKYSPTAENLIITWDNIQPFVEALWGNM